MPQRLLLGDGTEHVVGEPVEVTEAAEAAEAQIAAEAEPDEPAITPCRTAFTIFLMASGHVLVTRDLGYGDIRVERKPTFDEISYAASQVHTEYADTVTDELGAPGEWVALTAFSPYLTHDGRWLISADLNDPLVPDRAALPAERVAACAVVMRDVHTQEVLGPVFNQFAQALVQSVTQSVTQSVIGSMVKMSQQAMEAQQAMGVAQQLEADKHRRAGRHG